MHAHVYVSISTPHTLVKQGEDNRPLTPSLAHALVVHSQALGGVHELLHLLRVALHQLHEVRAGQPVAVRVPLRDRRDLPNPSAERRARTGAEWRGQKGGFTTFVMHDRTWSTLVHRRGHVLNTLPKADPPPPATCAWIDGGVWKWLYCSRDSALKVLSFGKPLASPAGLAGPAQQQPAQKRNRVHAGIDSFSRDALLQAAPRPCV